MVALIINGVVRAWRAPVGHSVRPGREIVTVHKLVRGRAMLARGSRPGLCRLGVVLVCGEYRHVGSAGSHVAGPLVDELGPRPVRTLRAVAAPAEERCVGQAQQ